MRQVRIDYDELRKATYGYQPEIAKRLNISNQSVSSKLNRHTKMTLDDLNAICAVVRRPPADFLIFEEIDENKKAA